jgi:hypothetical protein
MNDTTSFERERAPMGTPALGRRHHLALIVGIGGILAAMTTAMATAAGPPRLATADCPAPPWAEVFR